MCCLLTVLALVGPRVALIGWWFMDPRRFLLAFGPGIWPFRPPWPVWLWPVLGFLFLPWTTVAYLLVFTRGIWGIEWLWLALGLLIDLGAHGGGGYHHRERLWGSKA